MNGENRLYGLVVSKYGSIANFANRCDLSYSKAYRIIKGTQTRTEDDLRYLIKALDLHESTEIVALFSLA